MYIITGGGITCKGNLPADFERFDDQTHHRIQATFDGEFMANPPSLALPHNPTPQKTTFLLVDTVLDKPCRKRMAVVFSLFAIYWHWSLWLGEVILSP